MQLEVDAGCTMDVEIKTAKKSRQNVKYLLPVCHNAVVAVLKQHHADKGS